MGDLSLSHIEQRLVVIVSIARQQAMHAQRSAVTANPSVRLSVSHTLAMYRNEWISSNSVQFLAAE